MKNNRFGAIANDDSDEEVIAQKTTKTQVKKQERKITEKPPKVNATKMQEGGFEVINKTGEPKKREEPEERRGGRGGRGRGAHSGRGAHHVTRLDQDGNPVRDQGHKERRPFTGKPREGAHPYDRRSGTGRGRRPENKRDGHGKGNWGDNQEQVYKQKGTDENEERKAEGEEEKVEKKEEPKKEEKEEEKVQIVEEVIGVSLDDFLQTRNAT